MQLSQKHLLLGILTFFVMLALVACGSDGLDASPSAGTITNALPVAKQKTNSPTTGDDNQVTDAASDSAMDADESTEPAINIHCTETDPHPVAQDIAETYDVTYEEVMTWFCSGHSFDDILIALETSEATDIAAGDLLAMSDNMSWEEVWIEVGFTQQ